MEVEEKDKRKKNWPAYNNKSRDEKIAKKEQEKIKIKNMYSYSINLQQQSRDSKLSLDTLVGRKKRR